MDGERAGGVGGVGGSLGGERWGGAGVVRGRARERGGRVVVLVGGLDLSSAPTSSAMADRYAWGKERETSEKVEGG